MNPSPATQAALSSVTNYKQLDPTTATATANDQYGVGASQTRLSALQGVVGNLQSSLDAVDPSVTGRTSGTFTTEGQRSALVGKEQTPIAANLGKEQTAETAAASDLNQSQNLASNMASALLNGDKEKYQQLLDVYNASAAQDKQTQAEQDAQQQAAEQQREFNISASQKANTTSAADTKTNTLQSLNQDILSNVADYQNKPAFWTEKTLIPQLVAAYPELTPQQITAQVYALRKQYE